MTLNDVCHVITCGVAKRPEYVESGVPFLSSKNVKADRFILDHYNYVSLEDFHALTKHNKPENGDILYTRVGSFGEAAVISLNFEFAIFVSLTLLKPKQDIVHDRFLMHYLNSPKIRNLAINSTSGIGVQNLNVNAVRKFPINLPPLPIQRKIAEVLDAADRIRQRNKDILAKYDQLAQSVFLEMFGDTWINPHDYPLLKLSEVVNEGKIITYGIVQAGDHVEGGIPYIRTGDIKNGVIEVGKLLRTSPDIAKSYERSKCRTGDIIMSIRATVGTIAFLPYELDGANLTQGTARISTNPDICNPLFLYYTIKSKGVQLKIERQTKGATFREITLSRLRDITIPVPPLGIQNQFATIIEKIEQQKAKVQAELEQSEGLFQSLMQRAFRGELFQELELN